MDDSKNKVNIEVVDLLDLNVPEEEGTPLRPIFCLKNKSYMKEFEEREDCFILDFDPYHISKLSVSKHGDSPEISVIAEKGQVALRDFPHSRHSCVKYRFDTTNHESYCELCYCFVCDIEAPCKMWSGLSGHCHAMNNQAWRSQRKLMKELRKTVKQI